MEEPLKRKKRAATRTGADKAAARELCAGRVMRGSLVTVRRMCGKKSCRCTRGALHASLLIRQDIGNRAATHPSSAFPKTAGGDAGNAPLAVGEQVEADRQDVSLIQ